MRRLLIVMVIGWGICGVAMAAPPAHPAIAELDRHVADLQSDDRETRRAGLWAVGDAGEAGVARVLQQRARTPDGPATTRLQAALGLLAATYPAPLIAAVRTDIPQLSLPAAQALAAGEPSPEAIQLWSRMVHDPQADPAVRDLAHRALFRTLTTIPTLPLVESQLRTEAESLLFRRPDAEAATVNHPLWYWDRATLAPDPRWQRPQIKRYILASQLAADLIALDPENEQNQQLYLAATLAAAQAAAGATQPLSKTSPAVFSLGRHAPVERVQAVLGQALDANHVPLAVASLDILRAMADPTAALANSPLRRAIEHPHPRVRHAALAATLQRMPDAPFEGASDVLDELRRTIRATGQRRVLVVDPARLRGQTLAHRTSDLGFMGMSVTTAKDAIRLLRESPDFEAVLIHRDLSTPSYSELIQQLRHDPLTAHLPLAILYEVAGDDRIELEPVQDEIVFPRPADTTSLSNLLRQLLSGVEEPTHAAERLLWAEQALVWLAQVTRQTGRPYALDFRSLEPQLTAALQQVELAGLAEAVLQQLSFPPSTSSRKT